MNSRSQSIRLVNDPETSTLIGWLASQQRLAYNHGVSTLNRTPAMPKRAKRGSNHGLNKAMTAWRQANSAVATAPYHIHQQGSEAAWDANQLLQHGRNQRLGRIDRAVAKGEEPNPRDSRPHRRTLRHRSRKHGTQTLTVRSSRFINKVDNHSFTITGVDAVFRTKDPLPDNIRALHFVEIGKYRRAANAPMHCRRYELSVAIAQDDPEPADLTELGLSHYEGIDDGIKNNLTFSDGDVFHFKEPLPNRDVRKERSTAQRKKKGSKKGRRHAASCQSRTNRRNAERKRQANLHVAKHLNRNQPAAVCMENKSLTAMMSSASGPGRAQKAGLNRSLATAGLSGLALIVANQSAKRGIHLILVPPQGSSQTCPRCGHRHRRNRKTQASFRCLNCSWTGNADLAGATILRNRGFVRTTERIHGYTPDVEDAPTGWQEQPSQGGQPQLMLLPRQNTPKPKRNATRQARSKRDQPGSAAPGRKARVQTSQAAMTLVMETDPDPGRAHGVQSADCERARASVNVC